MKYQSKVVEPLILTMRSFREPVIIEEEEEEIPVVLEEEEIPVVLEEKMIQEKETPEEPLKEDLVEQPGSLPDVPTAVPLPFSYLYKIAGTSVVIDRETHLVLGYHDDQYRVIDKKNKEVEEVCSKYGLVYFHISYLSRILKSENTVLCSY